MHIQYASSSDARHSLNCKAVGKAGAIFGTFSFAYISSDVSFGAVMGLSSGLALLGAFLTVTLSESSRGPKIHLYTSEKTTKRGTAVVKIEGKMSETSRRETIGAFASRRLLSFMSATPIKVEVIKEEVPVIKEAGGES